MKKLLFTFLSIVILGNYFLFSSFNFSKLKTQNNKSEALRDGMREAFEQDYEMMKDPSTGLVPIERMLSAKAYKDQNAKKTRAALLGVQWTNVGPKNQGGRSRTMLIDANDASGNTVFVASVGGGIWMTTDFSQSEPNWIAINDFMDNLAITSLAQDPTNPQIMYAATGEGTGNGDAIRGLGVWKSTNGGSTWNQLAATNNSNFNYCQKAVVNSSGILLVSTSTGLYRSTNAGSTFTKVLGTGLGITGATSDFAWAIAIAANGDIYASLDGSIHKSTNAGVTFGSAMSLPISAERIELACAPNDVNYVYALVENGSVVEGILRTTNGGTSWTSRNEPSDDDPGIPSADFSRTQAWYDLSIAVDPNNKDVLMVGGIDLFKSTDGANTWTQISHWYGGFGYPYVHADQHFIHYKAGSSSVAYFCCDGGIFQTTNATSSTPTMIDKGTNYITTQFYGCAMHPTALTPHYLAGSQDNGTHLFSSNSINNTNQVTGGDGAFCNIDQNEPNFQFTQYVRNNYYRSTDGGVNFTDISESNNGRFINPSDYDDVNNRLYAARSNNQYLRWNNPQTGSSFTTITIAAFGGQVSAVKVSPNTNNRVFFGIGTTGEVFRVDNANNASPAATSISTGLPSGYVSCIEVESGNDDHLLVTYSNFGLNSVWETTNGGTSWTSVEGNLPDMPIRWALFNPNNNDQAILATELGVWSTDNLNGGSTVWGASNTGLANVRVDQLQVRASDHFVIASTHGRGLFVSDIFTDPTAMFEANKLLTYTSKPIQFTSTSFKATSWSWDFGDGNNSNVENPVHSYTSSGKFNVTLTINGGASTITKNQYIHILPDRAVPYMTTDGGNFDTNLDDFGPDNLIGTPWELGNSTIAGKNGTLSGANAWVTGLANASYVNNSDVRLQTPNYNMTVPGTYIIEFYRKNSFEIGWDGMRVEYSLNKGDTWSHLGNTVQANWYDFGNTVQNTAFNMNEAFFNGTKSSFSLCQFDISFLAPNPNITFRIRFKSDPNLTATGIAIDNFQLLGPPNSPLTLNLISFNASKMENNTLLSWKTENEIHVSRYELQRSMDGVTFNAIASINANNKSTNAYSFTDDIHSKLPTQAIFYYRLKCIDLDGKFSFSQTERIDYINDASSITISPNPFVNQILISSSSPILEASLYTYSGILVTQKQHLMDGKLIVDNSLPPGLYLLKVKTKNQTHIEKVIKR